MTLTEIIIQKIETGGPLPFRDFMEMSLYHPGAGYYTSAGEKIGKNGDFYTSPYLTSLFGSMIGRQLEEMWHRLGMGPFTIVEYGAGTGRLCHDILQQIKINENFYNQVSYRIIEKSPAMREKERMIAGEKVSWHDSIRDIPPFNGCILSNEVVDNFAVHQVVMEDELMEVFVDHRGGSFVEELRPAPAALKNYLAELGVFLSPGFRTEINLQAIDWIQDIAETLKKGFVMTIDYGHASPDLYNDNRRQGTLVCYHKHDINYDPYHHIGEQDITTHVNFSALSHWGLKNGLDATGFIDQASFLLGMGLTSHLKKMEEDKSIDSVREAGFIHTFLMDMGRKFKILIQCKGVGRPLLSGLQFSRRFV